MRTQIKNIGWNVIGLGLPLVAAAASIPSLIVLIGLERFGLLTVAWGLIGFAGIFDLGVGRAATQIISQLISQKQYQQILVVIKTAAILAVRMGLIGALLFALLALFDVHEHIKYDKSISSEVSFAAYILAVTIPVQSMSAMFRGVNEAFEAFREINLIRLALGVANFIAPLLTALFTTNLGFLILSLFASRALALFLYYKCAFKIMLVKDVFCVSFKDIKTSQVVEKKLFSFGGWVTVSNVIYPLMMQSDRFLIGILISASAVATYVLPYEMVIQALVLCSSITTAIFPILSAMVKSAPEKILNTFYKWLFIAVTVMFGAATMIYVFGAELLKLWLGSTLDEQSVSVALVLAMGLVPYAVGSMYLALIHAYSRPDITAKAHLVEMPIFLFVLYWGVLEYGVVGAAVIWVLRAFVDAAVLIFWFHRCRNVLVKKSAERIKGLHD